MPSYRTQQTTLHIEGVADLRVCALADRRQYADPFGAAAAQGISSAEWPLFGLVWPSGLQLAACIGHRALQSGERILELGCGLALASLVAHRRGADISASDHHPLVAGFLAKKLRLNRLAPLPYHHTAWALPAGPGPFGQARWPGADLARYDLLIGSDLLYDRDASLALAGCIARHASEQAEVWIVDPDRANRAGFTRRMAQGGWRVVERRLDRKEDADFAAYKGRLLSYRR
jgi:predicted nicotinamide N-methyase